MEQFDSLPKASYFGLRLAFHTTLSKAGFMRIIDVSLIYFWKRREEKRNIYRKMEPDRKTDRLADTSYSEGELQCFCLWEYVSNPFICTYRDCLKTQEVRGAHRIAQIYLTTLLLYCEESISLLKGNEVVGGI